MNTIIYKLSSRSVCILMDDMLEEEYQYEMRVRQSFVPGVKEITLVCCESDTKYFIKKMNNYHDMCLLDNKRL